MKRRRKLPVQSGQEADGLGLVTVMDRALAARYGVPYVHLAAIAIDLDRVNAEHGDAPEWPTGWEVFLTERYLIDVFDPTRPEDRELLEETCIGVMEIGQALGAQLPFAVYDAVERGVWPEELRAIFRPWRRRPRQLVEALSELWAEPREQARRLAAACLEATVEPPLSQPTRQALERMVGQVLPG